MYSMNRRFRTTALPSMGKPSMGEEGIDLVIYRCNQID